MANRKNSVQAEPAEPENSGNGGRQTAEKPPTIRSICEEGLLGGLPYAEIIANVKEVHPAAATTPGCVAWYRSKLAKRGMLPTGKELSETRKRAAEQRAKSPGEGEK